MASNTVGDSVTDDYDSESQLKLETAGTSADCAE